MKIWKRQKRLFYKPYSLFRPAAFLLKWGQTSVTIVLNNSKKDANVTKSLICDLLERILPGRFDLHNIKVVIR
ncbi:hypothetical protein C4569_02025 [Candidatus Parcubacteria bacterium]|nr:MAG: hypothetical protein C4569_02025 [Candidatus Parcubacteria bacterium]